MTKTRKHAKRNVSVLTIALLAILLVYIFGFSPYKLNLSGYSSGWEIYNQICGVSDNMTNTVLTRSSQFSSPNFISDVLWTFDVDDPNWGVPTMQVTIGDIHHVDWTGKDIPNDRYAEELTVTRGDNTFYLDYHIYLYTVTIRSIADVMRHGSSGTLGDVPVFWHETSLPGESETFTGVTGVDTPPRIGKPFNGLAYVKFIINPWTGVSYHTAPTGYVLQNAWAGVMNTYIIAPKVEGQVANQFTPNDQSNPNGTPQPDPNAPLTVKGAIDPGNQAPMFLDDGSFGNNAPRVNWDSSVNPDERINSTVVQGFPVQIFPGAKTHSNWNLVVDALYPADGYVMYTVRIDVLQTHEFVLETAYKPPTPQPPSDYYTWAESWWTSFLHGIDPFAWLGPLEPLAWWLLSFGIIIFIVIIILAIFAPFVLTAITGAFRRIGNMMKKKD